MKLLRHPQGDNVVTEKLWQTQEPERAESQDNSVLLSVLLLLAAEAKFPGILWEAL